MTHVHSRAGFSALFMAILLLVISVPLSFATVFLSIDSAQSTLTVYAGEETLLLAESCTEEALLQLRNDPGYADPDLRLPEGECAISITTDGDERTLEVTAEQDGYERTIQSRVLVTPTGLVLEYWKEVSL